MCRVGSIDRHLCVRTGKPRDSRVPNGKAISEGVSPRTRGQHAASQYHRSAKESFHAYFLSVLEGDCGNLSDLRWHAVGRMSTMRNRQLFASSI
jgi:hypothetical protein